jgi:hypothetical protein
MGGATGQSRAGASTNFEYSLGGKWLELLKEIAPRVTRVMIIYDPRNVRIFARASVRGGVPIRARDRIVERLFPSAISRVTLQPDL